MIYYVVFTLGSVCLLLDNVVTKYLPCNPQDFGHGSVVCMCSSSYCDGFLNVPSPNKDQYLVYTSSKDGERFSESLHGVQSYATNDLADVTITINPEEKRQQIIGFGGSFSDATSMNIVMLNPKLRQYLYDSYFSDYGNRYTLGRIPMASTDFSTRSYSYNEYRDDFEMKNFSLSFEDYEFKVPVIKEALRRSPELKLFCSPWGAPGWLKTSESMLKLGHLKGQPGGKYYQAWALYFARFLKEYELAGVPPLWGLTVQNEPQFLTNLNMSMPFPSLSFTAETEKIFIAKNLGPELDRHGFHGINLMMFDDMRPNLPDWVHILDDPVASQYVKGIALHWYLDGLTSPEIYDKTHEKYPHIFLLQTEASVGVYEIKKGPLLGSWERGEKYSSSVIENLNHWVAGWTDWNMVLDTKSGPNTFNRPFLDAPVIVDKARGVFYKQPMFYHLGHFSRFIPPGSRNVKATASCETLLQFTAFERPDRMIVPIVLNVRDQAFSFKLKISSLLETNCQIEERSISTFIFKV